MAGEVTQDSVILQARLTEEGPEPRRRRGACTAEFEFYDENGTLLYETEKAGHR